MLSSVKPRISAFPKCYLDQIAGARSMSVFDWIKMAQQLEADGLEMYEGFFTSLDDAYIDSIGEAIRGAGFEMSGPPKAHEIVDVAAKGSKSSFWTATFRKAGVTTTELQLYWAWNGGDGWKSPKSPRWDYAGKPALCKLYLSQLRSGAADERHVDEFLQKFVPLVDAAVSR